MTGSGRGRGSGRVGAAVAAVVAWSVAYGWPLWAVGRRSVDGVAGRPGLSVDAVVDVFSDARVGRLALLTLAQSTASVLVVAVLGVPLGWVLARLDFPGRRLVAAVVVAPFVLPTLAVAGAIVAVRGGLPQSDPARFGAIVAAHVVFNVGVMARAVATAVAGVPVETEQAAAALGRGPVRAALTTLAAVRSSIAGAALVVAVLCLTSFGVVVALGGASVGTVEVEIWYRSTRSLDLAGAAVLAAAQLVLVLVVVAAHQRLRPAAIGGAEPVRRRPVVTSERMAVAAAVVTVAVVSVLPLGGLVVRSLRVDGAWSAAHYRALVVGAERVAGGPIPAVADGEAWRALWYTLSGAVVATLVAGVLAAPAVAVGARRDRLGVWAERAMVAPLAVSAATLGLGYLLAFSGPLVDLRGSWVAVPLVQAATGAPVAVVVVLAAVRRLDPAPGEAAAVSGAGPWRRWRTVTFPALRRPVAAAAGLVLAMAVGEFGATVFLARQDRPTVPVLIGRLLGRPGSANLGQALALCCVLGAVALTAVLVTELRAPRAPRSAARR